MIYYHCYFSQIVDQLKIPAHSSCIAVSMNTCVRSFPVVFSPRSVSASKDEWLWVSSQQVLIRKASRQHRNVKRNLRLDSAAVKIVPDSYRLLLVSLFVVCSVESLEAKKNWS